MEDFHQSSSSDNSFCKELDINNLFVSESTKKKWHSHVSRNAMDLIRTMQTNPSCEEVVGNHGANFHQRMPSNRSTTLCSSAYSGKMNDPYYYCKNDHSSCKKKLKIQRESKSTYGKPSLPATGYHLCNSKKPPLERASRYLTWRKRDLFDNYSCTSLRRSGAIWEDEI